jgi:hypothetical protein
MLHEQTGASSPPAEQAIIDRALAPALATFSLEEQHDALSQGRNQPLSVTIALALASVPAAGPGLTPGSPSGQCQELTWIAAPRLLEAADGQLRNEQG